MKAYSSVADMDRSEFLLFFKEKEQLLNSTNKTTTTDYTLEEAFVSLEGIVNNAFYESWEVIENMEYFPSMVTLDYQVVSGERMVSFTEYSSVYTDIYNEVISHIDVNNDEHFVLVDLTIESIDDASMSATFGLLTGTAAFPPASNFFTPATEVTAVKGYPSSCDPNGTATNDAADFIGVYANFTAPWRTNCPNGIEYPLIKATFVSYGPYYAPFTPSNSFELTQIQSKYWSNTFNQCIGGPNPGDWQTWYNKIDWLNTYGLSKANAWYQQQYPNSALEFYMTDYHSHGPTPQNPNYYHGGFFHYGIITCK